jgi:uncharacterized membrane protein
MHQDKPMQVPNHVQEHIGTIAKHEQEFLARRSSAERLGDLTAAIVGNLGFVAAHIFLFLFWILANTLDMPPIPHFDPVPFSLLGTIVAMEAILLASLILMRQARLARRAHERGTPYAPNPSSHGKGGDGRHKHESANCG